MALTINDDCTSCDACPEICPNKAISVVNSDLRHRPGEVHRVRRRARRTAVHGRVPGGLHHSESGFQGNAGAADGEIPQAARLSAAVKPLSRQGSFFPLTVAKNAKENLNQISPCALKRCIAKNFACERSWRVLLGLDFFRIHDVAPFHNIRRHPHGAVVASAKARPIQMNVHHG